MRSPKKYINFGKTTEENCKLILLSSDTNCSIFTRYNYHWSSVDRWTKDMFGFLHEWVVLAAQVIYSHAECAACNHVHCKSAELPGDM